MGLTVVMCLMTETKDNEIVPKSLKKYPLREMCEITMNFVCCLVYNMSMKCADCDIITSRSNTHVYVRLNAVTAPGIV